MTTPIPPTFARNLDQNISLNNYSQPSTQATSAFGELTGQDIRSQFLSRSEQTDGPKVTQSTTASESFSGIYTDNILNKFANYTYHVRFSMVNRYMAYNTSIYNLNSFNNAPKVVIAESGATANYNITNFSITNTVSPGFKNQNQGLMQWKMTITEPYGFTFPDYLLYAAKSPKINIENLNRFPFFIELWFTGYDEDGNIVEPNVSHKIWRVLMLDFSIDYSHQGTIYNIYGIEDGALATSNQFAFTPVSLQLNKVENLGGAVKKLEEALNNASKESENRNTATTYKFVIPDELKNWQLTPQNKDAGNNTSTNGPGNTFSINRGQDLGGFMMTLISKCEESNKFLNGASNTGSIAGSISQKGLGRILIVYTDIEFGKYNTDLNDYEKTITYRMIPWVTTRVVSTPEQAKEQQQIAVQEGKLRELQNMNLIAKKYEFYHTGANTEVIRLEVKVESFWQITLPTYLGTKTYGQEHVGAKLDGNSTGYADEVTSVKRSKAFDIVTARAQADRISQGIGNFTSAFGSLGTAVGGFGNMTNIPLGGTFGSLTSGTGVGMNNSINGLISGNIGNFGGINNLIPKNYPNLSSFVVDPIPRFDASTNTVQNILLNSTVNQTASQTNARALDQLNISSRGTTYLEDIKAVADLDLSKDPLKVAFAVDNKPQIQNAVNGGAERKLANEPKVARYPVGQTIFGQTLGNLYDNKFMLEVEMTVRGDPYWLGMTNIEANRIVKGPDRGSLTKGQKDRANYLAGENMFWLTFQTGNVYDETTGFMKFNANSDFFNGIYVVLEVENKFENGSFTQEIKAFKEIFSQKVDKTRNPTKTVEQATEAVRAAPDMSKKLQESQKQYTPETPADLTTGTYLG